MADAVAARREARRRKILENSQNRLQIISGKSNDECVKESPIRTVIPEPEYEFPTTLSATSSSSTTSNQNGIPFNHSDLLNQLLSRSHDVDASGSGDGEVASDLASLLPQLTTAPHGLVPPTAAPAEDATAPTSIWESIILYKYDMVLLSIVLQTLFELSLLKYENGYIFLPVLVYIVTRLIWCPTQTSSGLANILMLLNGMTPATVQRILFVAQLFGAISRDIFVFLFTTIILQSLLNLLRDSVVT